MQSIYTTFYGPTNTRGSKIIARTSGSTFADNKKDLRRAMPYNHADSADTNHRNAAMLLAQRLKWVGSWIEGSGPNGRGNVYVCQTGADRFTIKPE